MEHKSNKSRSVCLSHVCQRYMATLIWKVQEYSISRYVRILGCAFQLHGIARFLPWHILLVEDLRYFFERVEIFLLSIYCINNINDFFISIVFFRFFLNIYCINIYKCINCIVWVTAMSFSVKFIICIKIITVTGRD